LYGPPTEDLTQHFFQYNLPPGTEILRTGNQDMRFALKSLIHRQERMIENFL
jgi:hypothetical protein